MRVMENRQTGRPIVNRERRHDAVIAEDTAGRLTHLVAVLAEVVPVGLDDWQGELWNIIDTHLRVSL